MVQKRMAGRKLISLLGFVLLVIATAVSQWSSPPTLDAPAEVRPPGPTPQVPIDSDNWVSPAGLVYRGTDPHGRSRLEHVARHARDIPDRDGPHGVFDGGREEAFATIDEAWRLAEEQGLKPRREAGRSVYDVAMGRRVGYLGGKAGAARGHPPLKRIRIVVATGTTDIITAFPR